MGKKILIINGHPKKESFCNALSKVYKQTAENNLSEVKELFLSEIKFDPILRNESIQFQELEPDLIKAQELINWAEHIVIIYPNWWGTMPALLKGFFDRTFTPKFAFSYRKNSILWDKLLTGKSGRIIVTMDTPKFYYYMIYQGAGHKILKNNILGFCGINPVKVKIFSSIKKSNEKIREKWLNEVKKISLADCA